MNTKKDYVVKFDVETGYLVMDFYEFVNDNYTLDDLETEEFINYALSFCNVLGAKGYEVGFYESEE